MTTFYEMLIDIHSLTIRHTITIRHSLSDTSYKTRSYYGTPIIRHTYLHTLNIQYAITQRDTSWPGLSIRQTRQMPRAYEGLGPTKVVIEAYKSKCGLFCFGPLLFFKLYK